MGNIERKIMNIKTPVYIAGKMTGLPDFNHPAFHDMELKLSSMGFEVRSPARIDGGSTDRPRKFYLRKAIKMLLGCESVVMLDGWDESAGACLELDIAMEMGMDVYDQSLKLMELNAVSEDDWVRIFPEENESVCQEADRIVSGDRQEDYGHPAEDFSRTAAMWTAMFSNLLQPNVQFGPRDVAMAMICLKLSRLANKYKRDSVVDICGYAKTMDMIEERNYCSENCCPVEYETTRTKMNVRVNVKSENDG